jgi:hypothetical protein
MRQMTGDILSLGSELFVHESSSNQHIKLIQFSSNRLDLKLISLNQNDSGIYTCMFNDEKITSFLLEIFGKNLLFIYSFNNNKKKKHKLPFILLSTFFKKKRNGLFPK